MAEKCKNCGSGIGGMFGAELLSKSVISRFREFIECPEEICTNCDGPFNAEYEKARKIKDSEVVRATLTAASKADIQLQAALSKIPQLEAELAKIPVLSVAILPPVAKYRLIDLVSFQSTLGTGIFSEFGSSISQIFGTEAKMMNRKMGKSLDKCKDVMRILTMEMGGNAVIGVNFQVSSNSADSTTVAGQGTAVFIENITEVFQAPRST